jgi:hypothetical protein
MTTALLLNENGSKKVTYPPRFYYCTLLSGAPSTKPFACVKEINENETGVTPINVTKLNFVEIGHFVQKLVG